LVTTASFCTLVVVPAADLQQIAIERRAQEFQRSHRVAVLTLVFTDIVDSTKLKQALGDREAVTAKAGERSSPRRKDVQHWPTDNELSIEAAMVILPPLHAKHPPSVNASLGRREHS
jgi:hypothetical protein